MLNPCNWNHDVISPYQHVVSPCIANCREDSSARRAYLSLGRSQRWWKKETNMVSASTTSGGVASSARIMACGTEALALISREIIDTKGFSMPPHPSVRPDLP